MCWTPQKNFCNKNMLIIWGHVIYTTTFRNCDEDNKVYAENFMAKLQQPGQDDQGRTTRIGQPGQDWQDNAVRTRLWGKDSLQSIARTRLRVQDTPGNDNKSWITRTGQLRRKSICNFFCRIQEISLPLESFFLPIADLKKKSSSLLKQFCWEYLFAPWIKKNSSCLSS